MGIKEKAAKKRKDIGQGDFVVRDELKCSSKIISGYRDSVTALAKAKPTCLPLFCRCRYLRDDISRAFGILFWAVQLLYLTMLLQSSRLRIA
jgi:hypothetical protein